MIFKGSLIIVLIFNVKKSYPKAHEIRDLDQKLDLLTLLLLEFPEQLRVMSLFLMYTGIDKGKLLMAKYDKMNEANRQKSEKKIELAIAEICKAVSEENVISVSDLSKNTGLSKGFFYKNEQVRSILNDEKEKQNQGTLAQIKRGKG